MKILIADDHRIFREGLRLILAESGRSFEIGAVASGEELLGAVQREHWDVIVLDISFPGASGLDLLRRIKTMREQVSVLMLSMHAEEQYAVRAIRSGASGYLTKETASDDLLKAIEKVAAGGRYVTPAVAEALAAEVAGDVSDPHRILSSREFEVLVLLARGRKPTEIAEELNLSAKTVSTYRSRILEKLGFRSNAQLIHYAIAQRLI